MTDINIKIKNLLNSLNAQKLDLRKIKYQMDLISEYQEKENYSYLEALLQPEKVKGVRIPSQIPVPSTTFQLKSQVIIKPNDKGCFVVCINPYFLADESFEYVTSVSGLNTYVSQGQTYNYYYRFYATNVSTFACNVRGELDGITPLPRDLDPNLLIQHLRIWNMKDIGQILPTNIYDQYRLVSASLNVRYIGPLEEAKGIIGGSILYDQHNSPCFEEYVDSGLGAMPPYNPPPPGTEGNPDATFYPQYENFDNLRDAFYHNESYCLEGLRMLYFPLDNSFEDFVKIFDGKHVSLERLYREFSGYARWKIPEDYYKGGFNWVVYGQGLPSTDSIRFEICCNFECLPTASFMNFCPIETRPYALTPIQKKQIYDEVKEQAVQKLNKI